MASLGWLLNLDFAGSAVVTPTEFLFILEAVILPSADGAVQLRAEPISGATTVTIRQGSLGFMREAEV